MGRRQEGIGRETDDDPGALAAIDLDAGASGRNEQRGGAEAVAVSLNRKGVDAGQIGEHQLGITALLHFAVDGGTPGGEEREISEADAAGIIEEWPVVIWMVPGVDIQGKEGANNATKFHCIGGC
jgi:hypothetical protein